MSRQQVLRMPVFDICTNPATFGDKASANPMGHFVVCDEKIGGQAASVIEQGRGRAESVDRLQPQLATGSTSGPRHYATPEHCERTRLIATQKVNGLEAKRRITQQDLVNDFRRGMVADCEDSDVVSGLRESRGFLQYARVAAEMAVTQDGDARWGAHAAIEPKADSQCFR